MSASRINGGIPRNQSLGRAVRVLQALGERPDGTPALQVAEAVELPLPTVMRTLATLADFGLVERNAAREWRLGYELVRLARSVDRHSALIERARPILDQMVRELGMTANLGVDVGKLSVLTLAQSDAAQLMRPRSWVGDTFGAHATAFGKLALARLPEHELEAFLSSAELEAYTPVTITDPVRLRAEVERVRRAGWSSTFEELETGFAAVAVAIPDEAHERAILVGVGGAAARLDADGWAALVPEIRRIAAPLAKPA